MEGSNLENQSWENNFQYPLCPKYLSTEKVPPNSQCLMRPSRTPEIIPMSVHTGRVDVLPLVPVVDWNLFPPNHLS